MTRFSFLLLILCFACQSSQTECPPCEDKTAQEQKKEQLQKVKTEVVAINQHFSELNLLLMEAFMLTERWVNISGPNDAKDKLSLINIQNEEWPQLRDNINNLASVLDETQSGNWNSLKDGIDKWFLLVKEVEEMLPDSDSYNGLSIFEAMDMVQEPGEIYEEYYRLAAYANDIHSYSQSLLNMELDKL